MDIYVNVGAKAPIYYKSTGNIETLGDHKHNSLEYGTAVFAGLWYGETKSRTSTAVFAGLGYCTNNTSYSLITDLHITYTKDEDRSFKRLILTRIRGAYSGLVEKEYRWIRK